MTGATAAPRRRSPLRRGSPLRRRGFALLWAGGLVSDLGDWTLLIGLPVFVFQLTGSALVTSTVFVAELLPALVVGQVGGVLVDRWDRKRILVAASVLQAVLLLPLLLVDSADRLWIVYLVAAAESALARVCSPASAALVPSLVPPDELAAANGLNAFAGSIARLVGSPVGGVAVQLLGLAGVVVVDALTFLVAAALVAAIPRQGIATIASLDAGPERPARDEPRRAIRSFTTDWIDGLRTIRRAPGLWPVVAIGGASQVAQGIFVVLYVVFVLDVLRADGGAVGLIRGMQAIGGIVGGLVAGWLLTRLGIRAVIGWGLVVVGLVALATWNASAVTSAVPVFAALFALVGVPIVAVYVGLLTAVQSLTPATHLGRVYAANEALGGLLQAVGVVIAGALADAVGVLPILDVQALIYVACGLAALALLPRDVARSREVATRPR